MRDDARPLTAGETALVRSVFGTAIDVDAVEIRRRRWWPLQPREVAMAPCGHLHVHPRGSLWSADYAAEGIGLRGLFVHEMTHVWQAQTRGRLWLPLMRHPFCPYRYTLVPGRRLADYGIEQQAEIVRHGWLARGGHAVPGDGAAVARVVAEAFGTGIDREPGGIVVKRDDHMP